jgi:hypothetical protein
MAKLHELLAAEKTPVGAWNQICEETMKKFKNVSHYFEEGEANKATEDQAKEEKPVTTTVCETLEYAFDIFADAEKLLCQKNKTNQLAVGTVMIDGQPFLENLPVDELLGLEARLTRIRVLTQEMPTLDATKAWVKAPLIGDYIWVTEHPEENTKTEKQIFPVLMSPATEHHPAQVQAATRDVVVGKFTLRKRSGAATTQQKAAFLRNLDALIVEIKRARMRANETQVAEDNTARKLVAYLLAPLKG